MTEIKSNLYQRTEKLAQEIATLQNYNKQWLEIHAAAQTDEKRIEALNAIKNNNDLIGDKSFQLNEFFQGRDPFDAQEVIPEPVADLTVLAKIFKIRYFNYPFQWLLYKTSSISVTDSEILLQPSILRFSSEEPDLVIIPKGQITSMDRDGIKVKIQTESQGNYILWMTDQNMAAHLSYSIKAFFSETYKLAAKES